MISYYNHFTADWMQFSGHLSISGEFSVACQISITSNDELMFEIVLKLVSTLFIGEQVVFTGNYKVKLK